MATTKRSRADQSSNAIPGPVVSSTIDPLARLGRRMRAALAPAIGPAYGGLPPQSGDVRAPDQRRAYPTSDNDYGDYGYTSFRGLRLPEEQRPGPWYSPGGPASAYGGGWADGVLTVRDRHVMTRRGHTRWGAYEANNGIPNPEHDGPPLPEYQMVDTTESWQLGTDLTTNEDNTGEHNWVPVTGTAKRFPLGQQDGTETPVWGPPIGEWREYGARGPIGMHGPDPDIWDPNWIARPGGQGAAASGGRGRLVQQGAPGMQPTDMRVVYGGVPHGLHSPTAQSTLWTGARSASAIQMTAPRLDRPNSSKIAGQSQSQTFPPEGALASRATPRQEPERRPGLDSRFRGRS